ncbi:MAG: hypothetical protein R3A47_11900 [Polyangiales bacterium]
MSAGGPDNPDKLAKTWFVFTVVGTVLYALGAIYMTMFFGDHL